jgi:hypothetical protein
VDIDCASGGWFSGRGKAGRSLVFPKLAAAIGYAERHGFIGSNRHGNFNP